MTKHDLIKKHMNNIAQLFGGWANEDINDRYIIDRFELLRLYEIKCQHAAETLCDGIGRGSCYTADKNKNVEIAKKLIDQWEKYILQHLQVWLKDGEKVKTRFFINTDPRGYALKFAVTSEEIRQHGLYTDLGGYCIITPDIKYRTINNEFGVDDITYYFN